jgi:hypothetical protein
MWREGELERSGRCRIWRKTGEREAAAAVKEGGEGGLAFWVGARVYIGRGGVGRGG